MASYIHYTYSELLNHARTAFIGGSGRPLAITGNPGIAKSAIMSSEFVEILREYYAAVLPSFYEEARELLTLHNSRIEETRGTPMAIGAINKCLQDFKDRPRILRVAMEWLRYCDTYGHDVTDILVEVEDKRLATIESTLLAGYPQPVNGRMLRLPDSWFPADHYDILRQEVFVGNGKVSDNGRSPLGILVADEANRGERETENAFFQLLERGHRIGDWSLKPGWIICMAMNIGPAFKVERQDGAWVGRIDICCLDMDFKTWHSNYASKMSSEGHPNVAPVISKFLSEHPEHFIPTDKVLEAAFRNEDKYCSPRDWTEFSHRWYESKLRKSYGLTAMALEDNMDMLFQVCAACVGQSGATAFQAYLETSKESITAEQLLDGVLVSGTPEAKALAERINGLTQVDLGVVIERIQDHIQQVGVDKMANKNWASLFMFGAVLGLETRAVFFKSLTDSSICKDVANKFKSVHADWHRKLPDGTTKRDTLRSFTSVNPLTEEMVDWTSVYAQAAMRAMGYK